MIELVTEIIEEQIIVPTIAKPMLTLSGKKTHLTDKESVIEEAFSLFLCTIRTLKCAVCLYSVHNSISISSI